MEFLEVGWMRNGGAPTKSMNKEKSSDPVQKGVQFLWAPFNGSRIARVE